MDATIKLSKEECARGMEQRRSTKDAAMNDAQAFGVCRRHGAYRTPNDESTAFEFDETTAAPNLPHQSAGGAFVEV